MTETKCIKNCTKARMTRKAEERTKAMIEWLDTNCPKMTKEEIINGLKLTIGECLFDPYTVELSTEQISFTEKLTIDACKGAIDLLEQEPNIGHWIEEKDDYGKVMRWHCDNCYEDSGFFTTCAWDFCPNCGAKMVEPNERSEKK